MTAQQNAPVWECLAIDLLQTLGNYLDDSTNIATYGGKIFTNERTVL